MSRASLLLLVAFGVVVVVEVTAEVTETAALVFLGRLVAMPLLAASLMVGRVRRDRTLWLSVAALLASGLGDAFGSTPLTKIGFFFVAQLLYVAAFWPVRHRALGSRRPLVVGYLVAVAGVIAVSAAGAGALAGPVAAYGASLAAMVLLATGLNRTAAAGGLLFLASDVVLAVEMFLRPGFIPEADAVNMALYLPGQLLLAVGVLRRSG